MRNLNFAHSNFQPTGPSLALRKDSVGGPFKFMNPTTAVYDIQDNGRPGGRKADLADLTDVEKQERAKVRWNARDYRKGRHVLVLPRNAPLASRLEDSTQRHKVLLGIARMFTVFPYWDVSWLIAVCFTVGCLIFVACGLFYWLPIAYPATAFPGESAVAGGVTCFVGAALFQVGACLLFLESYNDRAETQFGGALESLFVDRLGIGRRSRNHRPRHFDIGRGPVRSDQSVNESRTRPSSETAPASEPKAESGPPQPGSKPKSQFEPEPEPEEKSKRDTESTLATESGSERRPEVERRPNMTSFDEATLATTRQSHDANSLKAEVTEHEEVDAASGDDAAGSSPNNPFAERQWQWLPSWHDVRTHYIYELGFLASLTMSVGATIFTVCGVLALPGIYENLSEPAVKGAYFGPYLVGGCLFVISSALYVLETQPDWRTPQPRKLGWHIGVWNLVGGVGWTLAAVEGGYCGREWCEYQSELTLVWASLAFSVGSAFQWYEALDKYVVVIED
ncbi:integral membrane protein [Xylariaceae sp. FL0804]|nr:integral membrane protein [Xylariaceae sp. FL0804]